MIEGHHEAKKCEQIDRQGASLLLLFSNGLIIFFKTNFVFDFFFRKGTDLTCFFSINAMYMYVGIPDCILFSMCGIKLEIHQYRPIT